MLPANCAQAAGTMPRARASASVRTALLFICKTPPHRRAPQLGRDQGRLATGRLVLDIANATPAAPRGAARARYAVRPRGLSARSRRARRDRKKAGWIQCVGLR